ncbi:MAG: hypothetical protein JNM56_35575 [Planctomycetia bacterium]|nr:hypothetical protein [Planctomycetia bacterium]
MSAILPRINVPANGRARFIPAPHLPPKAEAILEIISDHPQTAKRLAGRLGMKCQSNFRQMLCDLARLGFIVRVPDGYKRVPVPPHRTHAQCQLRVARLYRMLARAIEQAVAEEGGQP